MAAFYVEVGGSDATGDGSVANPWRSITHAASHVQPGSTIRVGVGEFAEALVIDRDLTLLGASRTATVIRCVELADPYQPALRVAGGVRVRLESLRVDGAYAAFSYTRNGIFAEDGGADVEIEQCAIEGFLNYYVRVADGRLVVSNALIGVEPAYQNDVGIHLLDSTAIVTNATIGNQIDHCIDVRGASYAEITHCTINGSDVGNGHGVRLMDQSQASIGYNVIIGKGSSTAGLDQGTQSGIILHDEALAGIYQNEIAAFAVGIRFRTHASCRVWENRITGNFDWGIACYPYASGTALQPDLGGGRHGSPGGNLIHGNGQAGGNDIKLQGSGTVFARYNDWGDTDPGNILSRVTVGVPGPYGDPTIDFLPLAQVPEPVPLDAVVLLDRSGSMLLEGKWEATLAGIQRLTAVLSDIACNAGSLRIGLATFAATGATMATLDRPLAALPTDPAEMTAGLTPPSPPWGTPMGSGLEVARDAMGSLEDGRRKCVFLLSDGKHNIGIPPDAVYPGLAGQIAVYTVGFGDDTIDPEQLSEIALGTLGDYVLTGSTDLLELHSFLLNVLALAMDVQVIVNTIDEAVTSFPVNEGESKLVVHLGWADPQVRVDFDLRDPAGTTHTPTDLVPGIAYRGPGTLAAAAYVVDNPAAGDWAIANVRPQGGGAPPPTVRFAGIDARVVAQCWLDRATKRVGVPFRLGARIFEGDAPLEDIDVDVLVTAPSTGIGELVARHCERSAKRVRAVLDEKRLAREEFLGAVLRDFRDTTKGRRLPQQSERQRLSMPEAAFSLRPFVEAAGNAPSAAATGLRERTYTPAVEGTHTFQFLVTGRTRSGSRVRRSYTTSAYVHFCADPQSTDVAIERIGRWRSTYERFRVFVTPKSAGGERMGPFRTERVAFQIELAGFIGAVQEGEPGTYWRDFIKLPADNPENLRIWIDGVAIDVAPPASERS